MIFFDYDLTIQLVSINYKSAVRNIPKFSFVNYEKQNSFNILDDF